VPNIRAASSDRQGHGQVRIRPVPEPIRSGISDNDRPRPTTSGRTGTHFIDPENENRVLENVFERIEQEALLEREFDEQFRDSMRRRNLIADASTKRNESFVKLREYIANLARSFGGLTANLPRNHPEDFVATRRGMNDAA
jgi:hypothetical protein